MKIIFYLVCMSIFLVGCADSTLQASMSQPIVTAISQKEIKTPFDISDISIEYERAFVHDVNAVTILAKINNESGHDVRVNEVIDLYTTGADGFKLSHKNSYSMNGELLESESNDRVVLLYFKDGIDAPSLTTVQPSFEIEVDGEMYLIDGDIIEVE